MSNFIEKVWQKYNECVILLPMENRGIEVDVEGTLLVKASALDEILNIIWDCTTVCPPIHDFNHDDYTTPCPKHDEDAINFTSCAQCWKEYVKA